MDIFGEAAVIAAIIAVIGSAAVALLKMFFDWKNEKIITDQRIAEKMIDIITYYAADYYLPLIKRAKFFCEYLERINNEKVEEEKERLKRYSFFFFVMFIKAQNKLNYELGGVLLKSIATEGKIIKLIRLISDKININFPEIRFLINLEESELDSFISNPDSSREWNTRLPEIYAKYRSDISNEKIRESLIKLLKTFVDVFFYGLNSVYSSWYETIPKHRTIKDEILKELEENH